MKRVLDNCERCRGARGGVRGNENVVDGWTLCDYCTVDGRPSLEEVKTKARMYVRMGSKTSVEAHLRSALARLLKELGG